MDSVEDSVGYKGKHTDRCWSQLPADVVRLVGFFHLALHRQETPYPRMWRSNIYSKNMFLLLRDAPVMETLLYICPNWTLALESHPFWVQAQAIMDPQHLFDHYQRVNNSSSIRLSPCRHFLNLRNLACFVCRVNYPTHSYGISLAKRSALAFSSAHPIPLCRDHSKRAAFCAVCLRAAPPAESRDAYDLCIYENEDDESWPGLDATCRLCRQDELFARVNACEDPPKMLDALGGYDLASDDWETRLSVENFLDLAEGLISDVLQVAQEKYWLRRHTKLDDVLNNAVAAVRFCRRESLEEDEEEDTEAIYQDEERNGVRDLVLSDWARLRILDGLWVSPADQWYQHRVPDQPFCVPATHPLPWLLEEEPPESQHPKQIHIEEELAPTFALCETLYIAYRRQMRSILLPAMINLVRKIVIECTEDGVDPALRASRMSIEEVVEELRQEGVWYNGIDWLERRRNFRRERRARSTDSISSSISSLEDGEHVTSPVLSTTTVQTTPSPPPDKEKELATRKVPPIPVAAVEESPQLLQSIPHIPRSIAHLPDYSMDMLKAVWREACAPLYHCRCSICERAMIKAGGHLIPAMQQPQQQLSTPIAARPALPATPTVQNEVEADIVSETELSSFDSLVSDVDEQQQQDKRWPVTPPRPVLLPAATVDTMTTRPRKRSCDEQDSQTADDDDEGHRPIYEDDDDEDHELQDDETISVRKNNTSRSGSPFKRARVETTEPMRLSRRPLATATAARRAQTPSPFQTPPKKDDRFAYAVAVSPTKKRGSEELELVDEKAKRARTAETDVGTTDPPWDNDGLYTLDD